MTDTKDSPQKCNKSWTKQEEVKLVELLIEGKSRIVIAKELERTVGSINLKIRGMILKEIGNETNRIHVMKTFGIDEEKYIEIKKSKCKKSACIFKKINGSKYCRGHAREKQTDIITKMFGKIDVIEQKIDQLHEKISHHIIITFLMIIGCLLFIVCIKTF